MKRINILAHPSEIYFENIKKFLNHKNLSTKENKITIFWSTLGIGLSLSKKTIFDLPKSLIIDNRNFNEYKKKFSSELNIDIKRIDKVNFFKKLILFLISIRILASCFGNIEKLRSLEHKNVKYGDLLYYSYLKFAVREKIYFLSPFLLFLIYKSQCVFLNLNSHKEDAYLPDIFLSNYTSYLQHGLPARFYANHNIQSYSISSNELSMVVKHKQGSSCQNKDWKGYKKLLSNLSSKDFNDMRVKANDELLGRFKGKIDTGIHYMRVSPYSSDHEYDQGYFDGVVFLHDFFDSCDDFDGNIFNDIYDWAEQTMKCIEENNLNIAIKPHPNSVKQSLIFEKKLQDKYSKVTWLARQTSNADIFMNSKAGISMFGTVFTEIAYHGLIPIAAGSHPADQFEFTYQPTTTEEYLELIKNIDQLKPKPEARSKVIDFYVAHNYLNSNNEFFI
tara:strand:+ start:1186 stop:2526 length:1341 start_codon:yes stop_codon:yes gene_type:complete